jgi:hypothetical protein
VSKNRRLGELEQTVEGGQRQLAHLLDEQMRTDEALAAARQASTALAQANSVAAQPSALQSWLGRVALDASLDTDARIRAALSRLRMVAKSKPEIGGNLSKAIMAYKAKHGQAVSQVADLKPYLNPPLEDDILRRYDYVPDVPRKPGEALKVNGTLIVGPVERVILKEIPVDEDYDTHLVLMNNATMVSSVSKLGDALSQAERAFNKANPGQTPSRVDQLRPFITAPVEETALREYWDTRKK